MRIPSQMTVAAVYSYQCRLFSLNSFESGCRVHQTSSVQCCHKRLFGCSYLFSLHATSTKTNWVFPCMCRSTRPPSRTRVWKFTEVQCITASWYGLGFLYAIEINSNKGFWKRPIWMRVVTESTYSTMKNSEPKYTFSKVLPPNNIDSRRYYGDEFLFLLTVVAYCGVWGTGFACPGFMLKTEYTRDGLFIG